MYNKAFLIGNLTRDPELRYTPSGIAVARFTIAVNRIKKSDADGGDGGKSGQDVDFINIVAWRRLAEVCGEFLKKGRPVAIEGRLQIRGYVGKDGQKKTMSEVVADNMQMLGRKGDTAEAPVASEAGPEKIDTEEAPF
ncbi:MAG: single-stranded DNA-binding protein [Candidatus Margulisbacteria bacterium]|nr:single-stranded DNA-binding protein [Candidatus Margulisiibacteriota bacterium]MBU1617452.1 single-stranded DNA-binding protein [Candidatus Margulisiibacteriota bacterium]MBU1867064.1 single-stranded DNA-binding protein [Candidatus Margulisiibacteriota bacterium]